MKRIFLLTILISAFWLTGCEDDTRTRVINDTSLSESVVYPTVNWCQVVKLNDLTTIVVELRNNCVHVIGSNFTASFYDESNNFLYDIKNIPCLYMMPGKKHVVYFDNSSLRTLTDDAKKAEITVTYASEQDYAPITLNKIKEQIVSDGVTIGFTSQSDIRGANITVVFFYDNTIVGVSSHEFTNNDEHTYEYTYTCSNEFNGYKVYDRAYVFNTDN